ncbi:AMP-binding protein [Testudinibacter sp. P80/BLE/0925]|uniref:AMP-binding protein n=1 Tax=Testudinibacter sp. TW-1 TaxID=3417757 RepID=UPI003D35A36F
MNAFFPFDLSQFAYYSQVTKRCEKSPHFSEQTLILAQHLIPKSKVVLWFRESHFFIQALLAAWKVEAEVFILPDLSENNLQWANAQDYCLTDDVNLILNIPVYSLSQANRHPVNILPSQEVDITETISPHSVLWLKTSGSSGVPKLIKKTLRQFQAEAEMLKKHFAISADDLILNTVSQQHLYGLTFCIMLPLFSLAAICTEQWLFPEMLIEQTLQADRSVCWVASPMLLNHFAEHHNWAKFRHKIKRIFSAGGKLPTATAELFAQYGLAIDEIYGSTETGVIASRQGDTVWQALPSVQFQHTVQLSVNSAWIDQTEPLNDVLVFQANDRFVLQGRQDRIMKLADKRISLDLVEEALNQSDLVKECYCFQHPQQPRLIALTVLSENGIRLLQNQGRKVLSETLALPIKTQLGNLATPRFWRFVAALPRNTQGKIIKSDVLALFKNKPCAPVWQSISQISARWDISRHQEQQFIGTIPLDLTYFSGHFSSFPLVPGVVQLQWAIQLVESLGLPAQIDGVENLKYQQFIRPNNEIIMTLRWDSIKSKLTFNITKEEDSQTVICASGRIVYKV